MTAAPARPATFDRSNQARRSMLGKIHIAKKQLAMDEDDYRQLLFDVSGRSSAADCTEAQLTRVIDRMKRLGFKPLPKAGKKAATHPMARKGNCNSLSKKYAPDDLSYKPKPAIWQMPWQNWMT